MEAHVNASTVPVTPAADPAHLTTFSSDPPKLWQPFLPSPPIFDTPVSDPACITNFASVPPKLWQPFLSTPPVPDTPASAFAVPTTGPTYTAAIVSAPSTLWQPFLPGQPLDVSASDKPCTLSQSDLPLPPNKWLNQKAKSSLPEVIPLKMIKEKIPDDRVNFKHKPETKVKKQDLMKSKPYSTGKNKFGKRAHPKNTKKSGPTKKENQDETYESHPNMSRLRKNDIGHKNQIPSSDSVSKGVTSNSSEPQVNEKTKENEQKTQENGPKRSEKTFQLSNMGNDFEEITKEKTVCEDGVQILHSSEVQIKMKNQATNSNELLNDGPLQMAPDPAKKFLGNDREIEPHLRPQRFWEPETALNFQNVNNLVNS